MISQKCQSNFSVCYLNMRSNDIQIEYCVIAELASSCKGELISAPQHCSEASGLLPKSTGDVLWGERGRKSDKIDRSRWETPPPDGEKQPLPRPEWEKCSRQMCRNCPTHTHTLLNASCKVAQRHGWKRLRRTSVNNKASRRQGRRNEDGGGDRGVMERGDKGSGVTNN